MACLKPSRASTRQASLWRHRRRRHALEGRLRIGPPLLALENHIELVALLEERVHRVVKLVGVDWPVVVEEVRAPGLELADYAVTVRDLLLDAALAVPDVGVVLWRDVGEERVGLLLVLQGLVPVHKKFRKNHEKSQKFRLLLGLLLSKHPAHRLNPLVQQAELGVKVSPVHEPDWKGGWATLVPDAEHVITHHALAGANVVVVLGILVWHSFGLELSRYLDQALLRLCLLLVADWKALDPEDLLVPGHGHFGLEIFWKGPTVKDCCGIQLILKHGCHRYFCQL